VGGCGLYSSGLGERLSEVLSVYMCKFVVCLDVKDVDGGWLECMSTYSTMCVMTQNSYSLLRVLNTCNFHSARSSSQ
jgi:hypothetical protein